MHCFQMTFSLAKLLETVFITDPKRTSPYSLWHIFNLRLKCSTFGNYYCYHKSWRDVQWFESDHSFAPHQRIHISCKGNGNVEIYSEYHDTLEIVAKCSSPFPVDVEMDPKIAFRTTFFKTVRDKTNITHEVQIEGTDFNSCSKTCKNTTSFVFYSTVEPSLNFTIQLKLIRSIPDQINTNSCNDVEDLSLYISNGKAICESSVRSELELVNYITNNPLTTKMLHSCMLEHQNCRFPMSLEIRMTCNPPGKKENCIERKLSGHGLIHCSSQGRHKLLEYFTPLDRKAEGNMSLSLDTRNVIFLMKFSGWPIKPAQKEGISGFGTFFDTAAQTFNCDVVKYILILPVIWSVAFSNGTEIALNTGLPRRSLYLTIQMQFGMTAIKCSAGYWNSDEVATAVYNLNVKRRNESIPPTFIHKETTHFVELGSSVELNCTVDEADPLPLYDWKLLNSKLSIFEVTNRINKAVLVISAFNSFMAGDFVCNATNFLGESAIRTFKVRSPPVPTSKLWIYLSTAFGVIVILCGIIASLSWCYYLQRVSLLPSINF
ncbi:unnamed protein product [Allacma fusca]|uniref:Ig-like domain-containing protein n=1 Tax=Allacma fusca TaxID=39272 RepID=A0A8J2PKC7_9HEXA|nr:unnamed protein product [Allacma fusca]